MKKVLGMLKAFGAPVSYVADAPTAAAARPSPRPRRARA